MTNLSLVPEIANYHGINFANLIEWILKDASSIDKKNKIYIYLFIYFLLSTLNNVHLTNSNFLKFKINNIIVSGLSEKSNLQTSEEIKNILFENIFFIKKDFLFKILEKNNLINSFEIKKIYPDTIEVKIKKTEFLGITNIDGKFLIIGSNGKIN